MQLLDEVPMIWGSCYMLYCMHLVTLMQFLQCFLQLNFAGPRKAWHCQQETCHISASILYCISGSLPSCPQPCSISSMHLDEKFLLISINLL